MVRLPLTALLLIFLIVAGADLSLIYSSYDNFEQALDLALDAGLISGVIEHDSQRGRLIINEAAGYQTAREQLERNLKLDSSLTNVLYDNSSFNFKIELQGQKPVAKGEFRTRIKVNCLRVLGIDSLPMAIHKELDYVSSYI